MESVEPRRKHVSKIEYRAYNGGCKFKNNDILFARITPSLEHGKTCVVDFLKDGEFGAGSTEFIVVSARDDKTDPDYIYYLSISDLVRGPAIKSMTGTSGRQRVDTDVFNSIIVRVPSLNEQRAIAKILSDLDSKIELNQKMNKTLESIAQAIFKHWFIDFEFPNEEGKPYKSSGGEMVDSEMGEIPKGWSLSLVGKEIEIGGGTTPDTSERSYWGNGNVNWTTPKDLSLLKSHFLVETERKITSKGLQSIGSRKYPPGTLLMSSRAPIGYLAISEIETAVNQGIIAMMCNKVLSNIFMLEWCRFNLNLIENQANGTTFKEISKSTFRSIPLPVPDKSTVVKFDKVSSSIYKKISLITKQTQSLIRTRDALLPKLMSGKIRVSVVE